MCLLIWTVFSGERCGPWASCLKIAQFFKNLLVINIKFTASSGWQITWLWTLCMFWLWTLSPLSWTTCQNSSRTRPLLKWSKRSQKRPSKRLMNSRRTQKRYFQFQNIQPITAQKNYLFYDRHFFFTPLSIILAFFKNRKHDYSKVDN